MYVEEKLKLNKFEHVSLPSNSDLWLRSGCALIIPSSSQYSGEGESVPPPMRKTDIYSETMREDLNNIRREAAEIRDELAESSE